MIFNETFELNNGVKIPKLALGTWMIDDHIVADAVKNAIKIGYRHIDTAQAYGNERGVGEGIRNCGIPREEIFVTSKVAAENKSYASASASIDDTIAKMNIGYIDMMIIHSPQPWMEVNQSENRYFEENKEVWRALEEALQDGKVRAIGVSNFLEEDLESILDSSKVKPMVNQILAHISNTPLSLIKYCQERGIVVEAYSPVAHGEALKNPVITKMAEKYGVTVPQLCIKYDLQLNMVVLPKTANPEHMKSNAKLDFVISNEDMETLRNIEKLDYGNSSFLPVFGGKL
ncbi:MAG: aldo/keto reductase [Clostridia bacterium]|nr:aldo/keto reductase [Clostridia bacterium]